QVAITIGELGRGLRLEMPALGEQREYAQDAALLQLELAPAADQLVRLPDELNLADAARAELHVVGEVAPHDLALDLCLHAAQLLEAAVIEVAPVHDRPQQRQQPRAVLTLPRHRPRLDQRIALPVAP